jgi:hypothetical protein
MSFPTLASLLALFDRETRSDLFGPRTRGSVSEIGLEDLSDRPVKEFTPAPGAAFGSCRYFEVVVPEIQGRVGAVAFSDLRTDQIAAVKVRDAGENHGLEFFLDVPQNKAVLAETLTATIILGPASEDDPTLVVYTWHPGAPLAPLGNGSNLGDVAVKLHNGQ